MMIAIFLLCGVAHGEEEGQLERKKTDSPPSEVTSDQVEAGPAPAPEHDTEDKDDNSLVADDSSILSVEEKLAQLKKTEEEMKNKRRKLAHKLDLIRRVQRARSELSLSKIELSDAMNELEATRHAKTQAMERRTLANDAKDTAVNARHETELLIAGLKGRNMTATERTENLAKLQRDIKAQQKELERSRESAMLMLTALAAEFKSKGFEKWIKYNSDQLPELVKGTILKATDVLRPVAYKLEDVAEANGMLTEDLAERFHRAVPSIRKSPFYDGILFYLVLLFPTVIVTWLVLKIHARLAQLTVAHYVIAANLYFGMMSVLCLFMSLLSHNDILIVFAHRSKSLFEAFTLLHALLFVVHLTMHAAVAYVTKSSKDLGQLVSIFCVGLHFFVHAYKRTIFNQDPNIGAPAYFLYSIIFLYTLYDRGITILEAAANDTKSTDRSFGTFPPPATSNSIRSESRGAINKKTVYFAGLPVFSDPQLNASGGGGKNI